MQEQFGDTTPRAQKKFGYLSVLVNQSIYYIVLLLIVFGFKFIGGSTYVDFKNTLMKMLSETTNVKLVLDEVEKSKSEPEEKSDTVNADLDVYAEYGENDDTAYVFDLSEIRLLSDAKQSINSMTMPVDSTNVTSQFGYRLNPVTGKYGAHSGLDIGADTGDNIYAALGGTVVKAKYVSDYGNFLMIAHGDGLVTLYAHCSKLIANVGDTVEKGEVIALVGSTGRSTGPHLHFEVRVDGNRIDPEFFLTKLYEA